MAKIRLGLIGDKIEQSKSPALHRIAGRLCGLDVTYEPLIPARLGLSFDAVFDRCRREGYVGLNITYPYKEQVLGRLARLEDGIRELGAVNTVRFDPAAGPLGFNTDFSGFVAAFRRTFAEMSPGRVALIGAGGAGKAIAFGLVQLSAAELRVFDTDPAKADRLIEILRRAPGVTRLVRAKTVADAVVGADGMINATPIGMTDLPGCPVPVESFAGRAWAFDAVYTPPDTAFLEAARAAGLAVISGYELFFHQGLHAFAAFTGFHPDPVMLRAELEELEQGTRRVR